MKKYLVKSETDLRYENGVIVVASDIEKLFEINLLEFTNNAGSINNRSDVECIKHNIDDLYKYYNKELTFEYMMNELKNYEYIIEEYDEETIIDNETIIHLVVDLKTLESCDSYEEYYNAVEKCYIKQVKAMEEQRVDFVKARDSICYLIEREILDNLKQHI